MKRKTYASILVLAGVLCACGAHPVQQTEAEAEPTAAVRPTAPADNMLPEAEGVTAQDEEVPVIPGEEQWPVVGMVISRSGIDDGSFNQSAWEGLQWLEGSMDCHTMIVEAGDEEALSVQEAMEQLVQAGCDLCWGVGVNCADAVLSAAEKHPDVQFAIVDTTYEELRGIPGAGVFVSGRVCRR